MHRMSLFWAQLSDRLAASAKKLRRQNHFALNIKRDQDFVFELTGGKKIPTLTQLKYVTKFYTQKELLVSKIAIFCVLAAFAVLSLDIYYNRTTILPAHGGSYAEGVIGAPTYINPLFSQTNDLDQDITRLIFSGLMKPDESGMLVPDVAESYTIDEKQTTYTFTLRPDVIWHDSAPLTANDVLFTVQSIQDQGFKSPLYVTFRNVQVRTIDDRTISFTLAEPFAPFLSVLTFGILPEHLWQDIDPSHAILAELNLRPIGSGPYRFSSLTKDKKGNIKEYTVERFKNYYLDGPYIDHITFKFFTDFASARQALSDGNVDALGFLPQHFADTGAKQNNTSALQFSLPQYTALFFNQKSNVVLADATVRQALSLATSRQQVIDAAFPQYAEPIETPILPGMVGYTNTAPVILFDPSKAEKLLDDAGWKRVYPQTPNANNESEPVDAPPPQTTQGSTDLGVAAQAHAAYTREKKFKSSDAQATPLEVTLTTIQREDAILVAETIRTLWERIGITVNVHIVETGKIQKDVIKPRAYEVLLFGQILGRDPDPYPFWHSSQVNDPGLNLALYQNKEVDKLLEEARLTTNAEERQAKYEAFQNKMLPEIPAIFLYSLKYTYLVPHNLHGIDTTRITQPSDRFSNIERWFIKTKKRINFSW